MKKFLPGFLILSLSVFMVSGCELLKTDVKTEKEENVPEKVVLKEGSFDTLVGWKKDLTAQSLMAFQKSCDRTLKRADDANFSRHAFTGKVSDWRLICEDAKKLDYTNNDAARSFYAQNFNLYRVETKDKKTGLFTGYYEPSLKGSLVPTEEFNVPLYKRPDDLVMVDLGDFREELKGQRVAGRVIDAKLKPYEDRKQIDEGSLQGKNLEIVWVNDEVDAFFLHIQGSGRVLLDNGQEIRVGYDGQNGHPYHAIGKTLVDKGILKKEDVSLQSIKAWLLANHDKAKDLLQLNPSYVFFKVLEENGSIGGEGVVLTAGRSVAVDYTLLPYGTPMFLQFENPLNLKQTIARTMIAQDTGGAIRGAIRGDVFWGHGEKAEELAGKMKSKGSAWIMLPKTLTVDPLLASN